MSAPKEAWLVQVTTKEDLVECPMPIFRRLLRGTGIEVDRTYKPARVAPRRFVGRGFATARAARRISSGLWIAGTPGPTVSLFKEIMVEGLPEIPVLPGPEN